MFILTNKLQIRLASLTALLAAVVLLIASLVGGIASSAKTSASHLAQGHYPLSGALNLRVSRPQAASRSHPRTTPKCHSEARKRSQNSIVRTPAQTTPTLLWLPP